MTKDNIWLGAMAILLAGGIFAYGYAMGSGVFYESEYQGSLDSTQDYTGNAPDGFMTEYTTMTWQGRDSYGNFFVVYKPTNKGEPENTIVYTIFFEKDDDDNVVRLKVIDEKGQELIYKVSDYMTNADRVSIKQATENGIVLLLTKRGAEYNIYLPMLRSQEVIVVHGEYNLAESNCHVTQQYETLGRNASLVVDEIGRNFVWEEQVK